MSAEANAEGFKYPDWAKMPKNYDFNTRGKILKVNIK